MNFNNVLEGDRAAVDVILDEVQKNAKMVKEKIEELLGILELESNAHW